MEEEIRAKKEEYLKLFDKIFKTKTKGNISLKQVPLIAMIYETFTQEVQSESSKLKKLYKKRTSIYNKLEKAFTEEQLALIDSYCETEGEIHSEITEQVFIFGYIFSEELKKESKDSYKK